MDTIVLQSYRTADVPAWMRACMESVRAWARHHGWGHAFMDDAFFALAPDWARRRCRGNPYALADICRLVWLRDMLAAGYGRAIWADADMLVFAPGRLVIPRGIGHGFARELFMRVDQDGASTPVPGINNALMVFERGEPMLRHYLDACYRTLRRLPPGPVPRTALGPALLDRLGQRHRLTALDGVGLFSLALMQDLARGDGAHAREYLRHSPTAPAAANLCHFLRDATPPEDRPLFDLIYASAVDRLVQARDLRAASAHGGGGMAGASPPHPP